MTQPAQWPYRDSLVNAAVAEYGRPEHYLEGRYYASPDDLVRLREERLLRELRRAWEIPFFRRHWEKTGFNPGQFRGLEDLHRIPFYTVEDIRESIERSPPYGDYQGVIPGPEQTGLRMYFSGGTTGSPRPTVYTSWDRIVGSLMVARGLYMHGFRPGDIVINSWSYGTHNAAWVWDEALWLWLGCLPITASTGNVTASVKQLELARDYQAKSLLTTSDYLQHLRNVADEEGFKPGDFNFQYFQSIGDVKAATEAWQVPVYDIYAFHEVQTISAECTARGGLHIFDDAFIIEIVDTETGEPLPPGELGDIVVTCLYKSGSPQIRYNIKDLSRILPDRCACGSESTRMDHIAGRSDTMVKLRGINVWPEAVGRIAEEALGGHVEYFCFAYHYRGREEMAVLLEAPEGMQEKAASELQKKVSKAVQEKLGIKLQVKTVPQWALDDLTGRQTAAKLRRFRDERKQKEESALVKSFVEKD